MTAEKLKKGNVVQIRTPEGRWLKSNYLVEEVKFTPGVNGLGGMDEGSPPTWDVCVRRLNTDGSYNRRNKLTKQSYSTWHTESSIYYYKVVGNMKQYWE